jgi:hypothetical protein
MALGIKMDKWDMTSDPIFNELFDTWVDTRIKHFEEVEKPQTEARIRLMESMSKRAHGIGGEE